MSKDVMVHSIFLLGLLFAVIGVKVWAVHKQGGHVARLTLGSLALGLLYLLLIGTVTAQPWQWPAWWFGPLFFSSWAQGLGIAMGYLGLMGACLSMFCLGDAFRLGAVAQPPDRLVTTGLYSLSRNPFFCSLFIWYTGMFLLLPCLGMGCICLAFFVLVHRQVREEEAILLHSCGTAYAAYCKKVPRYILL